MSHASLYMFGEINDFTFCFCAVSDRKKTAAYPDIFMVSASPDDGFVKELLY
jgi:hypothetical protein